MEFRNFEELIRSLSLQRKKCAVVAAAEDEHALEAVIQAEGDGLITCLLVGNRDEICKIAEKQAYSFREEQIIPCNNGEAPEMAIDLIKEGRGDFLMKGKLQTADLLKPVVNRETGLGKGGIMSHVAILEIPTYHKLLAFTDGGMIPTPDLQQKIGIAENAISLFHQLGYKNPKVAALTAAETVNPKLQETVDAAELKKLGEEGKFGICTFEGPISFDLAVSRESGEIKGYKSPVTGEADIFLVPNMVTGNGISKALMYLAKATMAGCIIGAQVPIVLTSRGASLEEKYLSLALSAAMCS